MTLRFNLGFYDEEATLAQNYGIVRIFSPSDPQESYVNMVYTNVCTRSFL